MREKLIATYTTLRFLTEKRSTSSLETRLITLISRIVSQNLKRDYQNIKSSGVIVSKPPLTRVDFAYQRFFKGLGKYPRFKKRRNYRGWTYPDQAGWRVHSDGKNGYLELKDLGLKIRMRGQARTWGTPNTCTIFWDGKDWYASITVNCEPTRETGKGAIGLDFGCKVAIATSEGELIEAPKFQAKAQEKVNQLSKKLRRKRRRREKES